ncbi:MAG: hypothetical protein IPM96_07125 [Ignavibacteria bacterium]|nr:hypothetical protein [Ignavibacteria bacterium]
MMWFSPDGSRAYVIGSGTGYRVSTDGGATFNSNSTLTATTRNHIAISKSSPTYFFRHSFRKHDLSF